MQWAEVWNFLLTNILLQSQTPHPHQLIRYPPLSKKYKDNTLNRKKYMCVGYLPLILRLRDFYASNNFFFLKKKVILIKPPCNNNFNSPSSPQTPKIAFNNNTGVSRASIFHTTLLKVLRVTYLSIWFWLTLYAHAVRHIEILDQLKYWINWDIGSIEILDYWNIGSIENLYFNI